MGPGFGEGKEQILGIYLEKKTALGTGSNCSGFPGLTRSKMTIQAGYRFFLNAGQALAWVQFMVLLQAVVMSGNKHSLACTSIPHNLDHS